MYYFDLNEELPPIVKDVEDFKQINNAGSMELRQITKASSNVLKNFAIKTCDISTIEDWEQILNIVPVSNEDIKQRRQMILLKVNLKAPFTIETLKEKLNMLLTPAGYTLFINYTNQTYLVLIHQLEGVNQQTIKVVENLMLVICPAHMDGEVKLGSLIKVNYNEYLGIALNQATIYDVDFDATNI